MPISFRGSSVWAIELTTDIIVITNKKLPSSYFFDF